MGFFQNLFCSASHRDLDIALSDVTPRVSVDTNRTLLRLVTREEVKATCFDFGGRKAPGLDIFWGFFINLSGLSLRRISSIWCMGFSCWVSS